MSIFTSVLFLLALRYAQAFLSWQKSKSVFHKAQRGHLAVPPLTTGICKKRLAYRSWPQEMFFSKDKHKDAVSALKSCVLLSIWSLKNTHIYAAARIKVCYAAFRILAWNLITTSSKVRWCFFCSLCSFYVSHLSHRDYAALCKTILCVRTCVRSSVVFLYLFVHSSFFICNWTKEVYIFKSHLRSHLWTESCHVLTEFVWYFCETSSENIFCPSEIFVIFFSYTYKPCDLFNLNRDRNRFKDKYFLFHPAHLILFFVFLNVNDSPCFK